MILCIAEKKDVARKLSKVLCAFEDRQDYFEGSGYCITWCQGHLLELRVKESEGAWSLAVLPILPERFELGPISKGRAKDGTYIEDAGCKHRLYVIRQLMQKCESVICCTDAAREGQLIFENVYRYIGIRKPCKRLWISDLTEKSIKKGFASLGDNDDYADLGKAARLRAEGDWLVGINATRAFTLTSGAERPLSLGRVQTPTLCMICQRYEENKNFISTPFWTLSGETSKGVPFKYRCEKRFLAKEDGVSVRDAVLRDGILTVETVTTERKNEDAPLLHDIASLQKVANSKYGLTAKQTLDAAQALYEKQLISYPRTGSRFISEEVFQDVPEILDALSSHPVYGEDAKRIAAGSLNRRSVNETKVTDHHGLIVMGRLPKTDLPVVESQVYELVLVRFLEAFAPVCVADVTTVGMTSGGENFVAKGRREISLGWRAVCKDGEGGDVNIDEVDSIEMTMNPLPHMEEGEKIPIGKLELEMDMTKPKPLLTDATLLSCMENAGKRIEDKSIGKALKGIGIGTAATRDSVIEEIINRKYVFRDKKKLVPTDLGLSVYHAVLDKEIANVEMTAKWEMSLNDIADGDIAAADTFLSGIKEYATEITNEIKMAEDIKELGAKAQNASVLCPSCRKPVRLGEWGGKCACGTSLWRTISGKRLSDEQMKQLYEGGRTGVIAGFKGKKGNTFSAALSLGPDNKLSFIFPEQIEEEAVKCPKCGTVMRFSDKGAWCPSCHFNVWREVCHKKLSDKQLQTLILKGRTGTIAGFKSKAGKAFDATLVLLDDDKVQFEFNSKS